MEAKVLLIALMMVAIRLFGNLSARMLTGIDPRPVAIEKRLAHWLVSLFAAIISLFLAPIVVSI